MDDGSAMIRSAMHGMNFKTFQHLPRFLYFKKQPQGETRIETDKQMLGKEITFRQTVKVHTHLNTTHTLTHKQKILLPGGRLWNAVIHMPLHKTYFMQHIHLNFSQEQPMSDSNKALLQQ